MRQWVRSQSGQGVVEYAGALIIGCAVVALLVSSGPGSVLAFFEEIVTHVQQVLIGPETGLFRYFLRQKEPERNDSSPMVQVFLTGATGFVGRALVMSLLRQPEIAGLTCLVRTQPDWLHGDRLQVIVGDLLAPETYRKAIQQADIVLHVAARVGLKNGPEFHAVNTEGTRCLLAALGEAKTLQRLLFVSSISVYERPPGEPAQGPISEAATPHPNTDYGQSKLQAEGLIRQSGLPYTILRPSYIYGPHPRRGSSMDRVFQDVPQGAPYTRHPFPGRASGIFVQDLAEGIWHAAQHPGAENEDFFIANPEPVQVSAFFQAVGAAWNLPPEPPRDADPRALARWQRRWRRNNPTDPLYRVLFEDAFWCDTQKLERCTGYRPRHSWAEGVAQTVAWYRENAART